MAYDQHPKRIAGKLYKLTVFRVKSKFPNGTPRLVERLPEEGTARLSNDPSENEFITAFVPVEVLSPKEAGDK